MAIHLFKPRRMHSLFTDYPELKEVKEFRLPSNQMAFVNLYANPTSEFDDIKSETQKLEKCVKKAFGNTITENEKAKYLVGEFPTHIIAAINKMKSYNPSARLRAKAVINNVFDRLEGLVDMDEEKMKALDIEDKKRYAELLIKIAEGQQALVSQIESGYGITEDEEETDGAGMMEQALEQEI